MINKVSVDKERAKSMLKMAIEREEFINSLKIDYPTIIAENYCEIIKELSNALLLLNGLKAIGENAHKEIIDSLEKFAKFSNYKISLLQDLRIRRNKSQYEGKPFDISYLENKKYILLKIINELRREVEKKL